jgi:hypothetical protein
MKSYNPLEMTPKRKAQIADRARALWEEGGQQGDYADYMERADELIRMEMAGPTGQLPVDALHAGPLPGVIVDEAKLQENLGEFPAREE